MSPTDVAFSMAALMQFVATIVWSLSALLVPETRRHAAHWAAFSMFSALSFFVLDAAIRCQTPVAVEPLRALGNLSAIVATIALQRGIWIFIDGPTPSIAHLIALSLGLLIGVVGLEPGAGVLRVTVVSGVLGFLYLSMARDVVAHAWPLGGARLAGLVGLPSVLGAVYHGLRGARALLAPASVATEMTTDSALNVGTTFFYVGLAMTIHATLMALVVSRLVSELRRRSRHDFLTGLLNRRAMEEALSQEVASSPLSAAPFCVLMLDLDHFKSINDDYGHAVGDQALKHVAELVCATVRSADRVARFGGEEFLVLLPDTDLAEAKTLAERLRDRLACRPMLHDGEHITLSASIGIAEWGGPDDEVSRLLVRADMALYQAKQKGRDQVVAAPHERALQPAPNPL